MLLKFWQHCRDVLHPEKENIDPQLVSNCYSSLLAPSVMENMIVSTKYHKVKQKIIEKFVDETKIDSLDVQGAMDDSGISRRGYCSVFKAMKAKLKEKKIKNSMLPLPTHMKRTRAEINKKVEQFLGPPIHIQARFQNKNRDVSFNEFNNIFFDLEKLQQNMVIFYHITPSEVDNKLVFVLKLDECEVLKQRKTERITITLMNRALQKTSQEPVNKNSLSFFSVQSENNIWWLGSFEVDINTFIVLL